MKITDVKPYPVFAGIRNLMLHNELAPGQKIAYRDLAERLGMSQTPIIQALKWLEFQQLVRHEPHGPYARTAFRRFLSHLDPVLVFVCLARHGRHSHFCAVAGA